jgi:hypothetical protein
VVGCCRVGVLPPPVLLLSSGAGANAATVRTAAACQGLQPITHGSSSAAWAHLLLCAQEESAGRLEKKHWMMGGGCSTRPALLWPLSWCALGVW